MITSSRTANPLRVLQLTLWEIVSRYPTLSCVIPKEALIARNYQTTRILKNVHNAARSALPGFDLVNVNPTTVKKRIGGRGNATKKEVATGVRRICDLPVNYRFATDDVSDATGVGLCYLMTNEYKLAMLLP